MPAMLNIEVAAIAMPDRKSTRLNSSHLGISYAVFCLIKKKPTGDFHLVKSIVSRHLLVDKFEFTRAADKQPVQEHCGSVYHLPAPIYRHLSIYTDAPR